MSLGGGLQSTIVAEFGVGEGSGLFLRRNGAEVYAPMSCDAGRERVGMVELAQSNELALTQVFLPSQRSGDQLLEALVLPLPWTGNGTGGAGISI